MTIDQAAIASLEDERGRIEKDIDRLQKHLARISGDIGYVKFHTQYPVGTTILNVDGYPCEITNYTEHAVLGLLIKKDGSRGTRELVVVREAV